MLDWNGFEVDMKIKKSIVVYGYRCMLFRRSVKSYNESWKKIVDVEHGKR